MYFHRVLVSPSDKHAMDTLWGKLASEILMQNWDAAWEDLHRLRETIDANSIASPLQVGSSSVTFHSLIFYDAGIK